MNQYDTELALATLRLGGVDPDLFLVHEWHGHEELSQLYRFEVNVASAQKDLKLEDLLGRRGTLTLRDAEGRLVRWHGLVTQLRHTHSDETYAYYHVVLEPQLALLRLFKQSRVYVHAEAQQGGHPDLATVLRSVLAQCGLKNERFSALSPADFEIRLTDADLEKTQSNFICQFEETSLNFLMRRLEQAGVYFWFEQGEDKETVVFANRKEEQSRRVLELFWRDNSNLQFDSPAIAVNRFEQVLEVQPRSVVLRDFSISQPDLNLTVQALLEEQGATDRFDALGQVEVYGAHYNKQQHGEHLAQLRSEELAWQRRVFEGTAQHIGLQAGLLIELKQPNRIDYQMKYLLVRLSHQGRQSLPRHTQIQTTEGAFYQTEFVCIPSDIQYRPPQQAKQPRVVGFISAIIMAEGQGEYAEMNEYGCYKVQFLFAPSVSESNLANSAWVRMATPYAGSQHGMNLPLLKGTEVLVSFLSGNPDRPIIVSAIPNENNPSLLNEQNTSRPVLRTAGQNMLEFEDQQGQQFARLVSPAQQSSLQLGTDPSSPELPGVRLATQANMGFRSTSYIQEIPGAYKREIGRQGAIPVDPEIELRLKLAKDQAVAKLLADQAALPDASLPQQLKALQARFKAQAAELDFLNFLASQGVEGLRNNNLSLEEISQKIKELMVSKTDLEELIKKIMSGELASEGLAEMYFAEEPEAEVEPENGEETPNTPDDSGDDASPPAPPSSEDKDKVRNTYDKEYIENTAKLGFIDNTVEIAIKNSAFIGMTNSLYLGTEFTVKAALSSAINLDRSYNYAKVGGVEISTGSKKEFNSVEDYGAYAKQVTKSMLRSLRIIKQETEAEQSTETVVNKTENIIDKKSTKFGTGYYVWEKAGDKPHLMLEKKAIQLRLKKSVFLLFEDNQTALRHVDTQCVFDKKGFEIRGCGANTGTWRLSGDATSGVRVNGKRIQLG